MLRTTNGHVLKTLDKLDTARSFSVTMSGWATQSDCGHVSRLLILTGSVASRQIIFQTTNKTFEIYIWVSRDATFKMSHRLDYPTKSKIDFSLTFVQNVEAGKWIFFFNGQKIDDRTIVEGSFGKVWAFSTFLERSDDIVHSYLSVFASYGALDTSPFLEGLVIHPVSQKSRSLT